MDGRERKSRVLANSEMPPMPVHGTTRTELAIFREIMRRDDRCIPYSKFMEISLYGADGYYASGRARIGGESGTRRDFSTSPEVSMYFGAAISSGLSGLWDHMGRPGRFSVVELGAGNGTLALDILSYATAIRPDFFKSLDYTIVEISGGLATVQEERLQEFRGKIRWVSGSAVKMPVSNVCGAILSNELIDAFPVEVVTTVKGETAQKYVAIEDNNWVEQWRLPTQAVLKHIDRHNLEVKEGKETAVNLLAERFQRRADDALERGAILTIDYKDLGESGSITAVRCSMGVASRRMGGYAMQYWFPGEVDITSDVDFEALKRVATEDGLKVAFTGSQGRLLDWLGLYDRHLEIMHDRKSGGYFADFALNEMRRYGPTSLEEFSDYNALLMLKGIDDAGIEYMRRLRQDLRTERRD
ncbi:MAG: SAM-dependent methyltransferase [Candidatus Micrarchaeota archaeon]|nr:SAM-dependent methyltransferase [Candidatus Micrarchaeota archaeon]